MEILFPFEPYSADSPAVQTFLNSDSTFTEEFKNKVETYKKEKLEKLVTDMRNDIFYDHSIYTGSAGIALLYYTLAKRNAETDHKTLLKCLDYLNLDLLKGKKISYLCGDAGPLAIAAVVSYHLGSRRPDSLMDYESYCNRLLNLNTLLMNAQEELLHGKSGYLYSLLFVNKKISEGVINADLIIMVTHDIIKSGKKLAAKTKSESPLLWQWQYKVYLGGAHGMAGILYILLQARQYICEADLTSLVQPTLNWLLGFQLPSGNFPTTLGSFEGDRLVQWCHGVPGFVPLCLIAHQIFKEEKYLEIGLRCGEAMWSRMCLKGYSMCHGVAGNTYAFIQLYQATKDPKHLYRACRFFEWCTLELPNSEQHIPDRPASLFEGLAGRVLLADDMLHIDQAAFPGYTA